jgi:hypothetical protein
MIVICSHERSDENISIKTEAYYEEQASQEKIYLEEREEETRMILESDDPPSPQGVNLDGQLVHAAEELIVGDSDEPPLSEETVEVLLRVTNSKA